MLTGHRNKCNRCKEWHQKLFLYWDNMNMREEYMCLSCLAELTATRIPAWVMDSLTRQMIDIIQDKLEEEK